jgi:structural maintenance of chromosomes protein 6
MISDWSHCEKALKDNVDRTRRLQIQSQRIDDEILKLTEELERDSVEDGRLQVLETTLHETEEEKGQHEASYQDAVVNKDRLGLIGSSLNERVKEFEVALKEAEAVNNKAARKLVKVKEARMTVLQKKNMHIGRMDQNKALKLVEEQMLNGQKQRAQEFTDMANGLCPRVDVEPGETHAGLEKLYQKLDADIKNFEKRLVFLYCD